MKLIGLARIGNDPELRYTQNGDPVISLSLAYNYGKKDPNTREQPTQWVNASIWGERAERLINHLQKGQQLYVEVADLHIEEFQGRNGPGVSLRGRIVELRFAGGSKSDQDGQGQASQPRQTRQQPPAQRQPQRNDYAAAKGGGGGLADMDSDIPFAPLAARRAAYCV